MKIVGCDLHPHYQQVAMLDAETGELIERRLEHESGEARAFYANLTDRCGWGSKPPDTRAGPNGCWPRGVLGDEVGDEELDFGRLLGDDAVIGWLCGAGTPARRLCF
jgi:hypothetical protein